MPTKENIRPVNNDSQHAQLERLRASESFIPTRSPPPTPVSLTNNVTVEEISYFSDSDGELSPFERVFSFKRGTTRRYVKSPNPGLNCVHENWSTESLEQVPEDQEATPPSRLISRSVTIAAARALAASERIRASPTWPQSHPLVKETEQTQKMPRKDHKEKVQRGISTPLSFMMGNRMRSRQGSFLKAGTVRKPKQDKKKPQRSHTVADPEVLRLRRQGGIFFS